MDAMTYRIDKDILYIDLSGRIDATNSAGIEAEIARIRSENPGLHTVLDAEELEYISSAGLRVVLRLRKEEEGLAVINVSPEVYDIFDMTGFTDMLTVEKAFRRLSVEGCEFIAKGANGAVYRFDSETIVKTYFNPDSLPEIRQERENARKAFILGVNTAIPYGIVRVGNGYGTVTELLDAVSLSKLIRQDPENLDAAVSYYVDMIKNIHSITVEARDIPSIKETVLSWVEFLKPHLAAGLWEKLHSLVLAVPDSATLLHGDYHTNNIMVRDGESLLIDMDTLSLGHPIFELGSMFNAFVGFSELNHDQSAAFLGYSFETAGRFWRASLERYLGTVDEDRITSVEQKAMVLGYTRMLRRALRRPNEPESPARIARCTEMLEKLLPAVDSLEF